MTADQPVILLSAAQIEALRTEYAGIKSIDPTAPSYVRLVAMLDIAKPEILKQLAESGIKWISMLARNRVIRVVSTNGANTSCADCGVKPGKPHTPSCNGGNHILSSRA